MQYPATEAGSAWSALVHEMLDGVHEDTRILIRDGSQPEFRLFHFIIAFYLLIFVQKYQKLMPKITQICMVI